MLLKSTLVFTLASVGCVSALPNLFAEKRGDGPGHPGGCNGVAATRKKLLTDNQAKPIDIAVTIQERGCAMDSNYVVGDIYPNGTVKTGDAANFGPFKNNWLMIRTHCTQFAHQQPEDYKNGQQLNGDANIKAAITCQQQQMAAMSQSDWFVGQRGCGDGGDYGNAINFILGYLNQGHLTDDQITYYQLHNC